MSLDNQSKPYPITVECLFSMALLQGGEDFDTLLAADVAAMHKKKAGRCSLTLPMKA